MSWKKCAGGSMGSGLNENSGMINFTRNVVYFKLNRLIQQLKSSYWVPYRCTDSLQSISHNGISRIPTAIVEKFKFYHLPYGLLLVLSLYRQAFDSRKPALDAAMRSTNKYVGTKSIAKRAAHVFKSNRRSDVSSAPLANTHQLASRARPRWERIN